LRILITGCGGFVGGHLAAALTVSGHDVVGLFHRARPAMLEKRPRLRLEQADLAGDGALPPAPCDALIHCAAAIPANSSGDAELICVNVEGARRIFAHAADAGAGRIVFCSSMAAFGEIDTDLVGPDTPSRNPGTYGRSKLAGEALLDDLTRTLPGLGALSIRLPGVVGAGSHDNFLSDTMTRLIAGAPVVVRNPDALFNNVVHVADLLGFVSGLVLSLPPGHRVVTIAADDPQPIRRVMGILEDAAGRTATIRYEQGGRPFLISSEAARELGYRPSTVIDSVTRFALDALAASRGATAARPSQPI
jgi:nucleoside-diphosphate-sugar epimerase